MCYERVTYDAPCAFSTSQKVFTKTQTCAKEPFLMSKRVQYRPQVSNNIHHVVSLPSYTISFLLPDIWKIKQSISFSCRL